MAILRGNDGNAVTQFGDTFHCGAFHAKLVNRSLLKSRLENTWKKHLNASMRRGPWQPNDLPLLLLPSICSATGAHVRGARMCAWARTRGPEVRSPRSRVRTPRIRWTPVGGSRGGGRAGSRWSGSGGGKPVVRAGKVSGREMGIVPLAHTLPTRTVAPTSVSLHLSWEWHTKWCN